MRNNTSGKKSFAARHRNSIVACLSPFMLIGTSHALISGTVGTLYNGALPSDAKLICQEGMTSCMTSGIQEVWYGTRNSWVYKIVNGKFTCDFQNFSDPIYGYHKACYVRDLTTPSLLPPQVTEIPVEFNLNDLLSFQNKRYTVDAWDSATLQPVTASRSMILKARTSLVRYQQNYFQFNINDSSYPVRQHSIFISPTFTRCITYGDLTTSSLVRSYGRIVEIHSVTAIPTSQSVPQRSDVQKICTNDKSQLKFNLKPPVNDTLQVKIVDYDAQSKPSEVVDFFIPLNFDWMTK